MVDNSGYIALANSLSNAGQQIGGALQNRFELQRRQQSLAALAPFVQSGDWAGGAKTAFEMGEGETGLKLSMLAQEQKKLADQRAIDQQALGAAYGVGGSISGGVTPNPTPQPMNLNRAIIGQESGGNPNIGKSVDGAMGIGQILPDTFKRFAQPGEDINNPEDNARVSQRMTDTFMQKYGDPARAAVAYFSGEGNVAPPGSPTPWKRDARDGNGKSVSSYVGDVLKRMSKGVQVADASGAIPQSAIPQQAQPQSNVEALIARRDNMLRALQSGSISNEARQRIEFGVQRIEKDIERANQKPDVKQFGDFIYRVDQGGNITPVQKVEKSAQEKALTEGQSNAALFSDRMLNAEKIISDPNVSAAAMGWSGAGEKSAGSLPFGLGGKLQSGEFKRYDRAKRDFIAAALRKESGASISPSEYEGADKMWFPQPWDDEQTINDKAQARQVEIEGMRRAIGPNGQSSNKSPIPTEILDQARAAIATKGRDAVINRLKEQFPGFDGSGL